MTGKDPLKRYVLGTMDENERAELEQQYFADDAVFEELLDVEYDLVDGYVDGTLDPAERKLFEERFMTTAERRERVELARTLRQRITPNVAPASAGGTVRRLKPAPHPLWLAAAASFALVGFVTAWLIFAPRQRDERPQLVSRPPAVQPAKKNVTEPTPVAAETALITLVLTPGGTRGGEAAPPLVLRSAPRWVELDLLLEQDRYDSYNAELQDVEGSVLWSASSLRAAGGSVKPKVPARLLPPGDYVVVLYGVRGGLPVEMNNYTFTVTAVSGKK